MWYKRVRSSYGACKVRYRVPETGAALPATGAALPATGAMGTTLFYLVGIVMITGTGIGVALRRKMYRTP